MNYKHKEGEAFHTKGIENILSQTTEEHIQNLEKEKVHKRYTECSIRQDQKRNSLSHSIVKTLNA